MIYPTIYPRYISRFDETKSTTEVFASVENRIAEHRAARFISPTP